LGASTSIDHGLEAVARLDILIAKAAYSVSHNGVVPVVKSKGEIFVESFLHPILLTTMEDRDRVVPIDLRLSSATGEKALVISGPNGGGKTLSMKSFGLVTILTKLGIPIPIKKGSKRPRVDYFDDIFVNVGDQQSVVDGESTWTAILNTCANMIQSVAEQRKKGATPSYLVLLDELGTGTDPESGGAVAQAILEELITNSCKVVVTTHLPRLKTLSYNDAHIGCAAVLLDYNDLSSYRRPSFKLEYGLIGESHALNAASRCVPSLPATVLSRASELLNDVGTTEENVQRNSYIQALTCSMEEQLERSRVAASLLQDQVIDSSRCRQAMVCLARAYGCHLDRKLEYLEAIFQKLKANGKNDYEIIGETLSELSVVKKMIVTQEEHLATQGLKALQINYKLRCGESVVIISNGVLEGTTATVVADGSSSDSSLGPNQVLVNTPSSSQNRDDIMLPSIEPVAGRALILQRQEIAIWDIDSIYDDNAFESKPATSIANSKQKINSLLATLNSVSKKKSSENSVKKNRGVSSYRSSRQRKAANKAKKKRKK
jgi:dsDNA-specific endonuclease/ATPase MutS2